HSGGGDLELQDEVACSCRFDGSGGRTNVGELAALGGRAVLGAENPRSWATIDSRRSLAVDLIQAVLKIQRLAGEVREVDDDVHALGGANTNTVYLNGRRNEITVCANQPERIGGGRCLLADITGQEELIEARWTGIQQAEAIATRRYLQKWLNHAIH